MTKSNCSPISVGEQIAPENLNPPAQEALIQVDGGHIPTQEQDKRSEKALSAVVYRPESLHTLDRNHREITSKS